MGERAIVGLCGTKGSGKSTAAQHLKKTFGALIFSFAGPLKKACQVLFGFHTEQLYGTDIQKQTLDPFLGVSARDLLQVMGTEVFRNNKAFAVENETIWIANMRERISRVDPFQDIVIDDLRFPDEAEFITSIGGMTFLIERPFKEIEILELEDDVKPPMPTDFCEHVAAEADLALHPIFHALTHVVPKWEHKTAWERATMMAELERELNLLPQRFPTLPWMGKGYIRANIHDAKKIMYPDFMSFWTAMRHQTLLFREPAQSYHTEHASHPSEKMNFTTHETIVNDVPLEEFQERVFAIIPFVHTRKIREEAQRRG